jgi:hypothetical protein
MVAQSDLTGTAIRIIPRVRAGYSDPTLGCLPLSNAVVASIISEAAVIQTVELVE